MREACLKKLAVWDCLFPHRHHWASVPWPLWGAGRHWVTGARTLWKEQSPGPRGLDLKDTRTHRGLELELAGQLEHVPDGFWEIIFWWDSHVTKAGLLIY